MTWNYRLIHLDVSSPDEPWYEVREVFYNDDGAVASHSEAASAIVGNDIEEAKGVVDMLREAFDKPVLLESELPGDTPVHIGRAGTQ